MIRNFAKEIRGIENKPGRDWPKRWRQRHKDEIIYTYTTGMDRSRYTANSTYKYTLYFKLINRKLH